MKVAKLALTLFVVAVLSASAPAYADQQQNNLSLSFSGAILSAGAQSYSHAGGTLVMGALMGNPVDPSKSSLQYSLRAHVDGLSADGEAHFSLGIQGTDGSTTRVTGDSPIGGMVPVESFPLGCPNAVVGDCTSAIPGAYLGAASLTIQTCGEEKHQSSGQGANARDGNGGGHDNNGCSDPLPLTLPMIFESAFLSPFGGPIFMADVGADGVTFGNQLLIVATYDEAQVNWSGSQLGGGVSGTLSGTPVFGAFAMTVSAHEDLMAGTESEHGTIALTGMTRSELNAAGHFQGDSIIPPGADCSAAFGFPPGTCQLTGFSSQGVFSMDASSGGSIKGTYSTAWDMPAVTFVSTISATFSADHGHGGDGGQQNHPSVS